MSKASERLCQYCSKPVGYGDHEQYCSENPVNLARVCKVTLCRNPGNVIYDYEWICRNHADLRSAHSQLKSRKGSISFAKSSMERLNKEIDKIRQCIPAMIDNEIKAQEHLEKTKFKAALTGIKMP